MTKIYECNLCGHNTHDLSEFVGNTRYADAVQEILEMEAINFHLCKACNSMLHAHLVEVVKKIKRASEAVLD